MSESYLMANCRLMRTPPSAMAEGAKNTFDYGAFAKPVLNAHHITTGPIGLPKVIDDGKKRRYRAVGEGEGKSTFDSDGLVLPLKETDCVHHVSTGPKKFSKVPSAIDDSMQKYGAVGEGKGESTFDSDGVVLPLLSKETDYVHHVSTSPQNFSNPPRALQTCALGDPTRYLPLLIGDGNFSDKNLHNSGPTPQGKKFPKSLALKNDEVVATHTSSARDDGDKGSGGARGTMAYQLFDGLVDPQNSSGLVKLVSAKPTACTYPTSIGLPVEGTGAAAEQDFKGLVEPISIFKVSDNVHNISTSPQKFSNPPRALQTCTLGDPKKIYLPLYGSMQNCQDLKNHGENFALTSKALCNFNHIATEHSPLAIGQTVNNIQAKHKADFCSDLAAENMDCNDESALSMGGKNDIKKIDKNFCPNFIADDTDINRLSSNQETAVCCETKNGSEKNDGKKTDEIFGPKFISDDTYINWPYPHQETAVGCVTKNESFECDVKKIDVNFHPQFPSDEMDTKQYGTKKSRPHPIRAVGCEAKNDSVECDIKKRHEKFYPESLSDNLVTESDSETKDMVLPINLTTIPTDDVFEMGAPKVKGATKDMVLHVNLATIPTDDVFEMGAPNITSGTKNPAKSCENMIIDDEVQGKSAMNPESRNDMRAKFALENLDFIGYRMTFENNNLPNLIFEDGKFSAELFEKFKKRRANLMRTLYTLFNKDTSQPSRSNLSKLLNISQNGLKVADILHKKYLSTKMS